MKCHGVTIQMKHLWEHFYLDYWYYIISFLISQHEIWKCLILTLAIIWGASVKCALSTKP